MRSSGSSGIEARFSLAAGTYDRYAGVQRETAGRLLALTDAASPADILEIGCGTGNYTALLKGRYPSVRIRAVDISAAMVERAREKNGPDVQFEVMDVRRMRAGIKYDLVTSNACLHWIGGSDEMIKLCAMLSRGGGVCTASVFGPRTFHELAGAFSRAGRGNPVRAQAFASRDTLARALADHFGKWDIEETHYYREFGSAAELLRVIRHSGVRGDAARPSFIMTPDFLRTLEREYRAAHGAIVATFQVFFIRGYG